MIKLQNGLIDLCGRMLHCRDAVKTDASRLVSEKLPKDNESHHQETCPSQHMKPPAQQPVVHGDKPRAGGESSHARKKRNKYIKEGEIKLQMFKFTH